MKKALIDDEWEVVQLQASELACDIADEWARSGRYSAVHPNLNQVLTRLELVTRTSAMRKVRP